jgi:NAD(P)-dependent dehydrogenase (short-subunit alcohol dehydrogenase family)
MRDFTGRVAVVTGAASGIGRALAERFAREGMKVALSDIEERALQQTAAEMRTAGHHVLAVRTDVADAASVEALARDTLAAFGAVHIVCNNAGVVPGERFRPVWEYALEDWRWGLDVNLWGVIHGVRTFVPTLLAQGEEGHVVNTASIAGLISGSGSPVYGVAKHAVVRLTEALYASLHEMGARVGASVLCPGLVQTNIYRSERNRPAHLRHEGAGKESPADAAAEKIRPGGLTPEEVADQVLDAIRSDRFYVITTSSFDDAIRSRSDDILARRNPVFPGLLELARRDSRIR